VFSAEPEGVAESSSESTSSPIRPKTGSSADKLRSKLRNQKLPEGTEVNVETSQIVVTRVTKQRQKRSPAPEDAAAEPG